MILIFEICTISLEHDHVRKSFNEEEALWKEGCPPSSYIYIYKWRGTNSNDTIRCCCFTAYFCYRIEPWVLGESRVPCPWHSEDGPPLESIQTWYLHLMNLTKVENTATGKLHTPYSHQGSTQLPRQWLHLVDDVTNVPLDPQTCSISDISGQNGRIWTVFHCKNAVTT